MAFLRLSARIALASRTSGRLMPRPTPRPILSFLLEPDGGGSVVWVSDSAGIVVVVAVAVEAGNEVDGGGDVEDGAKLVLERSTVDAVLVVADVLLRSGNCTSTSPLPNLVFINPFWS